jgi:hypothetical protein
MELSEFREDINQDVKAMSSITGDGTVATFAQVVADKLIEAEIIQSFQPSFFLGSGKNNRKLRVDGYYFDDFDFSLTLFIVDYNQDDPATITKTVATQSFDKAKYFIEEILESRIEGKIEISTAAYDLVLLIKQYRNHISKFRVFYVTNDIMSERISVLEDSKLGTFNVEHHIWDIARIMNISDTNLGAEDNIVDFEMFNHKSGIPCLNAESISSEKYKSYLCIISGSVLADIYDKYGSKLLEGNVRSFLSTKVAVNKSIRSTIISKPEMFFAFNNGISVVASEVIFSDEEQKNISMIKKFQIINGGQTTASLSRARFKDKADLSQIFVQMKLTILNNSEEEDQDLIKNISKSSNSQNKVSEVDFFSSHPFHVRIEGISRRTNAPSTEGRQFMTKWFYERARGQYVQEQLRLSKNEKEKFMSQNPKSQLITKTDLAKVWNSWRGYPHWVSKGAQTNFVKFAEVIGNEWDRNNVVFNEQFFKNTVSLVILFKHLEVLVSNQSWYEQGYRANIVTYSIALFSEKLKKIYPKFEFDFQQLWMYQKVPNELTPEFASITKLVFESITSPKREIMNVTQWCKQEKCWNLIKDIDYKPSNDIVKLLKTKEESRYEAKEAKVDQKIVTDSEIQMEVINKTAEFWVRLHDFTSVKKIGSPEFEEAIKLAKKIPYKIPNPYQCKKLLEYLERAESEGFK